MPFDLEQMCETFGGDMTEKELDAFLEAKLPHGMALSCMDAPGVARGEVI